VKTALAILAMVGWWNPALGQLLAPVGVDYFASVVTNSDVIAIVSAGVVTSTKLTNAVGDSIWTYAAEIKLERPLKGSPPSTFRIEERVAAREPSVMVESGTPRWLVFLKKNADHYIQTGARSIGSIYGSGSNSHVTLPGCFSMGKAEDIISKRLAKK
jgi:hypothetical protein